MPLFYQSQGLGQPLVLLHGLFGSGDNWTRLADQLAQTYQVIRVDLRNHGRSPQTLSHSYAEMADDLLALLDVLGLTQVNLLGHSMGGKVAMTFACRYPERLQALVVVDMAMRAYPATYLPHIEAMLALDMNQITSRRDADIALSVAIPNVQVRQFLLTNLIKQDAHFVWRLNLTTLKQDYANIQAAVCERTLFTKPSLFIHGAHSDYLQHQDIIQLRQHFTQAQFVSLPTGHWVHAEQPALFIDTVHTYLANQPPLKA